jgi:hypothetical protein
VGGGGGGACMSAVCLKGLCSQPRQQQSVVQLACSCHALRTHMSPATHITGCCSQALSAAEQA